MRGFGQTHPGKQDPLQFAKMAGAGNDFVIIDNRASRITSPSELTRRLCTRRLSVGADGLILIEPSARATFRMRYLNADGSPADFCANGTRCAARFAFLNVIAPKRMTIETDAGVVGAEVADGGAVTLSLPSPRMFRPDRPLRVGEQIIRGSSILVGVPHYVVFLRRDLWQQDIDALGRAIRHHPELAPEGGANVNFVQLRDWRAIDVRTWERGVEGETLACGSGVVASVAVSALYQKVKSPVTVLTRSGISLEVWFELAGGEVREVRLKGDARLVYRAALTPETIEGFDPEWVRNPSLEPASRE
ncbi:MAG TPA: diaminopimelate epimerase [Thermoanaerobaculia bacterium]|jgi:diaminopimelate epimerase|nr:diaminopimelate epimerase [Thermoanaerobaculia bacterium]